MTNNGRVIDYYSQEEVRSILNSLSNAELKAIVLSAHVISRAYTSFDGDDLVNDVINSLLKTENPRRWPRNLNPKTFFKHSMLSHASNNQKKSLGSSGVMTDTEITPEYSDSYLENVGGGGDSVEDLIDASYMLDKILKHFSSDADTQAVITGRMNGWSEKEIKKRFNLTQSKYDSARKRLVRGWSKISLKE